MIENSNREDSITERSSFTQVSIVTDKTHKTNYSWNNEISGKKELEEKMIVNDHKDIENN